MAKEITFLSGTQDESTVESPGYGMPFPHGWAEFVLSVTAAGTGTLDVSFQYYDPASATWVDLAGSDQVNAVAFPQATGVGESYLSVGVTLQESAGKSLRQVLPSTLRAVATVVGDPFEFSVSGEAV